MADINEVVKEAISEVKNLGGNVAQIHEKVQKELAQVRSEFGELKAAAMTDPLVKERIEAFGASMGTKIEEAQKAAAAAAAEVERKTQERIDAFETAMRRKGHNGGPAMEDEKFVKAAAEFAESCAVVKRVALPDGFEPGADEFEQFRAYRKAFPLFMRRDERALGPDVFKTLSSGSDPDGGYLVTPDVSARILAKIYETSPIRQLAAVQQISGTELEIRVDHDETDFEWVGETDLPSANKTPQLGKKRIVAHTMASRPKATQQLLEDASVDLESWLAGKVADKFARGENAAFLVGTGRGQPRGLLTYPAGTTGEAVEQIVTGSATGFTFDGIVNAIYSLKEGYHTRAVWLMQRLSIAKVMLVKDGDNTFIFKNILMPGSRGLETTLAGYPLRMAADVPAVATNALCAVFGDVGAAYQIVDRLGISTQRDPFTQKPFIEFYTRRRVGGDVVNFEAFKLMKAST